MSDSISRLLGTCAFFDDIPAKSLEMAAKYFNVLEVEAGGYVFKEGDDGDVLFVLVEGKVAVRKSNAHADEIEIAIVREGRTLGEMALLDGEPRSASCVAQTDAMLLSISNGALERMSHDQPWLAYRFMRNLARLISRRLRMTNGKLVDFVS